MKLRLTSPAARQLDQVLEWIAIDNPAAAKVVQRRLKMVMALLLQHPEAGSLTSRPAVRRMVVLPYPYVIFYRVGQGEIVVHGIRHTARRPI